MVGNCGRVLARDDRSDRGRAGGMDQRAYVWRKEYSVVLAHSRLSNRMRFVSRIRRFAQQRRARAGAARAYFLRHIRLRSTKECLAFRPRCWFDVAIDSFHRQTKWLGSEFSNL